MLLDSNIIIYGADRAHAGLREFISGINPHVSGISYVEVFGFTGLQPAEADQLRRVFALLKRLPVDTPVLEHAARLRQRRRMSLGDAIIAGTAIVHDLTLVTRNITDFQWIEDLSLLNPFDPPIAPNP